MLERLSVTGPAGVENLVAAVLGVDLREHHQFRVTGITAGLGIKPRQMGHLVIAQSQTQFDIATLQRRQRIVAQGDGHQRARLAFAKALGQLVGMSKHGFGQRIVQILERIAPGRGIGLIPAAHDQATPLLQPCQLGQPADPGNVGGLARPRRHRAQTGRDQHLVGFILQAGVGFNQQRQLARIIRRSITPCSQINPFGTQQFQAQRLQTAVDRLQAKIRQRRSAEVCGHVQNQSSSCRQPRPSS